jgi:hypothetical protein
MKWNIDEMKRQRTLIGVEAGAGEVAPAGYTDTTLGAAQVILAQKKLLLDAATAEHSTRGQWLDSAVLDQTRAQTDIDRAQGLLKALVEEIVPIARAEVAGRDALDAAKITMATTVHAAGELGVPFAAATDVAA